MWYWPVQVVRWCCGRHVRQRLACNYREQSGQRNCLYFSNICVFATCSYSKTLCTCWAQPNKNKGKCWSLHFFCLELRRHVAQWGGDYFTVLNSLKCSWEKKSVNKYLKNGFHFRLPLSVVLPIKCEHFNMYAFTLPLAQMSENGNVSMNIWVNNQFAGIQSLAQL